MQQTETGGPKVQTFVGKIHVDATECDLKETQVANIGECVFAGIDEGKAVEHEAGRGNEVPAAVLEQTQRKEPACRQWDGYVDGEFFGGVAPDRELAFAGFAPGKPGRCEQGCCHDADGQAEHFCFEGVPAFAGVAEVFPDPSMGYESADDGAGARAHSAEAAEGDKAGGAFHHPLDVLQGFQGLFGCL